jgi:outer membrane receptor for ferrienterochelin and colicins
MMKFINKTLSVIVLLSLNLFLTAQVNCDWSVLNDADQSYRSGNFEETVGIINKCIGEGFNNTQKIQGYRLLAKTFLALDNDSSANDAVNNLLNIDPKFQPDYLSDPPRFIKIIETIKKAKSSVIITSVSKKEENIYEAPATAVMISENQIKMRGYLDMEALMHDLPGFDISRSNGNLYTHLYQRGYRSINTNRTLFLIDGVEENDLWSSNVYLSRQLPLSNVKSIEVIYGPASTMYGSNAFLGVINVITKDPSDFIKPGKLFGVNVETGYGSYNTKFVDGTLAMRNKSNNISLSLTGRMFYSNEQDLSIYPEHDYASYTFENDASHYHSILDITDSTGVADFFTAHPDPSNLYYTNADSSQIILTDEGIQQAIDFDNSMYDSIDYQDKTEAWSLNAKLKIYDFTIGYNYWSKSEGTGSQYTDLIYLTTKEGATWRPVHNYIFAKYDKDLGPKINISNFITFKTHDFNDKNGVVLSTRYWTGDLNLDALVNGVAPFPIKVFLFQKSNQLREEFKAVYTLSSSIDFLAGFEARFSSIQGDYIRKVVVGNTLQDSIFAEEQGSAGTNIPGGNQFFSRDLGVYIQSDLTPFKFFKLTLGLRYDNNLVRQSEGYGNAFNPRIALVLTPGTFIVKAIYAEAFKDATNREKYSTSPGKRELPNPLLEPEKVKNFEFSIGKSFFSKSLNLNAAGYKAYYSNIIQEVRVQREDGTYTNQNQPVGKAEIMGINAFADYNFKNLTAYANYTYTNPYFIDPKDSEGNPTTDSLGNPYQKLRIRDIATHSANFGLDYLFKEVLNFDIRMNFIGKKLTGYNTTVPTNPDTFDPYFLLNGAITYSPKRNIFSGLSVQLTGFNLLNLEYSSPGLDYASGDLASSLIQNKRNFYLTVSYQF